MLRFADIVVKNKTKKEVLKNDKKEEIMEVMLIAVLVVLIAVSSILIGKKQITKKLKICPFCGEMAKGEINLQRPYLIRDCCAKKHFPAHKTEVKK